MLAASFRNTDFPGAELVDLPTAAGFSMDGTRAFRTRESVADLDFFRVVVFVFFLAGVLDAAADGCAAFDLAVPAFFFVSGKSAEMSISMPNTSES